MGDKKNLATKKMGPYGVGREKKSREKKVKKKSVFRGA